VPPEARTYDVAANKKVRWHRPSDKPAIARSVGQNWFPDRVREVESDCNYGIRAGLMGNFVEK